MWKRKVTADDVLRAEYEGATAKRERKSVKDNPWSKLDDPAELKQAWFRGYINTQGIAA